MTGQRVKAVITGMGLLTSVAETEGELLATIREGRSGLREIETFDPTPFRTRYGGELPRRTYLDTLSEDERNRFHDPNLPMALTAARRALADAGIALNPEQKNRRIALVVGTCNGGLRTAEDQYRMLLGRKAGRFNREMALLIRYHTIGKALSFSLGIGGPTWVVATACSSSTGALGITLDLIEQGLADTVLVGGSDALCLSTMAGFDAIRATSTGRTAPFSVPSGLNLGEGAAFFVVETAETAAARGAPPLGEILGYALSADAHHPTAPDPRGDGAYRTMAGALDRAGITVDDIGCINAHGTGTDANDRVESKAVARLIGDRDIPVYAFKSQVGHCLGAAGIIEAAAGLVAMRHDTIPATTNFTKSRPGCHLNYVPNHPVEQKYDRFISCNYAFGGNNAGVVIGKPTPASLGAPDRPAKRTVITGSGVVSALGLGTEATVAALEGGQRGLSPIASRVAEETTGKLAGLVPHFDGKLVDRRVDFRAMNPMSRFATAAARLALGDAGIRLSPREGLNTGVVNGVYVGPNEEDYMRAVISSDGREADIGVFSQVVANATAGWVSNALQLKGYATTVAEGADAGLFALLAARQAIRGGGAIRIAAGAADELYPQYLRNYSDLDYLHVGRHETEYGLNFEVSDRRVVGEGAAYVIAEERQHAEARGATILAEIVGHGMNMDTERFFGQCAAPDGIAEAICDALRGAKWSAADVGVVVWSPQGNRIDRKSVDGVRGALGGWGDGVPFVTSVFHTGLLESASGILTLSALLDVWRRGRAPWPQVTGNADFDRRPLPLEPTNILVVVTSELGFNLALAIAPEMTKP